MKSIHMFMIACGALSLTGCNQVEVKEKLKTVYKETNSASESSRPEKTFSVTAKYGALKVKEGTFAAESKITPWSAWWYPLNERTLFEHPEGGASTLEKYDYYAETTFGVETRAADVEAQELYRANEVAWAGLCHAWAIASVLHPEPTETRNFAGVKWTVGDQKALLLKTYEKATGISDIMFGERYTGGRGEDYDDIYPDQFHRLVQHHMFERGLPFLMDYDPRHPVWTVPVYKVSFNIEKLDDSTALVDSWVTFASPHVDKDFVGTKRVVKNYRYHLTGAWEGDTMRVQHGEWIEDSRDDHPDYLIAFPDSIKRGSKNEEIKAEIVDSIF